MEQLHFLFLAGVQQMEWSDQSYPFIAYQKTRTQNGGLLYFLFLLFPFPTYKIEDTMRILNWRLCLRIMLAGRPPIPVRFTRRTTIQSNPTKKVQLIPISIPMMQAAASYFLYRYSELYFHQQDEKPSPIWLATLLLRQYIP